MATAPLLCYDVGMDVDAAIQRYESKVDRSGGPDACHPWTAGRSGGYGMVWVPERHRNEGAHRWGYEATVGPIPAGMVVCHTCDNPPCQNPRHWFVGTHRENSKDRDTKQRHTPRSGEAHPRSKLTDEQVRSIRREYVRRPVGGAGRTGRQSGSARDLAERYGVSHRAIQQIVAGRSRRSA